MAKLKTNPFMSKKLNPIEQALADKQNPPAVFTEENKKETPIQNQKSVGSYFYKGVEYPRTKEGRAAYMQAGGVSDVIRAGEGRPSKEEEMQMQQQQAINQEMAGQVGQVTQPEDIEASNLNYGQAIGAGVSNVIPGIIGGAVTGAVGGAAVGGIGAIPGAIGGAVIGGVGTFITGVRSDLKGQLSGEISASGSSVTKIERNLRALVSDTNQNPQNAAENIMMFNQQMALLAQEHAQLKKDSSRVLGKFLSQDGTAQLQRYELFYANGGARDFLTREMQQAIFQPNPTRNLITTDDLIGDVEE